MRPPIGSRLHGVLDYLTGTKLIGASFLPVLRGRFAGKVLRAAGASHIAYSLVTRYELGAVKLLPYKAHLGIDAAGALGLAAAPHLAGKDGLDRWVLVGVGAYELGAVLLSDPQGKGPGAGEPGWRAVTVEWPEAEVSAFLADPEQVSRFSPGGDWQGEFRLREAPGGRGTELHAKASADDLRRAKQLIEAGEVATAAGGPAGRRGPLSAVLPTKDTGAAAKGAGA
ncbi:MAG TPA: hypothetical protein VFY69_01070 [Solirubrobacterales bacterium]|nr:hypothetical protein [Solirubrobacterales bacterium]